MTKVNIFYLLLVYLSILISGASFAAKNGKPLIDLSFPHANVSPAEAMTSLAKACNDLGIEKFDVYGDFDDDYAKDRSASWLRRFEQEVSTEFGKDDALFLPSGVMAQSIALLLHASATRSTDDSNTFPEMKKTLFACHHSSHLLLHENEGYSELLDMSPVIISTEIEIQGGVSIPPMRLKNVEEVFDELQQQTDDISALIMELPHREVGGKLTPWEEVQGIAKLCHRLGIKYHCDGARIFEASAGYGKSVAELSEPFDSVYISFYKGLGALSGAMLLGEKEFIAEARVWLRRFGGNLYTLLPYAASSWSGYRRHYVQPNMPFTEKRQKLIRLVERLSKEEVVKDILTFDPAIPEINMVHGYLRPSPEVCDQALEMVESELKVRLLRRVRATCEPIDTTQYKSRFEWTLGDANGCFEEQLLLDAWKSFAGHVTSLTEVN